MSCPSLALPLASVSQAAEHLFTECDKQERGHGFGRQMGLGSSATCVYTVQPLGAPILGLKVLGSPAVKEAAQLYLSLFPNLFDQRTYLLLQHPCNRL